MKLICYTIGTKLILPLSILFGLVASSAPTSDFEQADRLTPNFFPIPNSAARALIPYDTITWQTPIQSLYTFSIVTAGREVYAACHPIRLSFFGTKDKISPLLCMQPSFAKVEILSYYYLLFYAFNDQASDLLKFLDGNGIDPEVDRDDRNTPQGWAHHIARRFVFRYLAVSGWNVLGLEKTVNKNNIFYGAYPRRYTDTTGYTPKNPAYLSPGRLLFPLRWQPLVQRVDQYGDYSAQVHITPNIGQTVKPMSMGTRQWNKLRTEGPYKFPNSYRRISLQDHRQLRRDLIPGMLSEMRKVYTETDPAAKRNKMFRSLWWDVKFSSLGSIASFYDKVLGLPSSNGVVAGFGENMALVDATVLAWREKVRHDLGRPGPLLRRLMHGKNVTLSKSIPVEEWGPLVRTMPHSEFPSASAVMCSAVITFVKLQVNYMLNGTFVDPGMVYIVPTFSFDPFLPQINITVKFDNLEEMIEDCGNSRVWSGLHFKPSVTEGKRVGRVVGKRAFMTWKEFEEGRVPKHCHWCLKHD